MGVNGMINIDPLTFYLAALREGLLDILGVKPRTPNKYNPSCTGCSQRLAVGSYSLYHVLNSGVTWGWLGRLGLGAQGLRGDCVNAILVQGWGPMVKVCLWAQNL
jgi:hypothetical protein